MIFSKWFDTQSDVIQGDMIRPVLFIIVLDQLVQSIDTGDEDISVSKIDTLRILGYTYDTDKLYKTVDVMTARLTNFADESIKQTDMKVKPSKTYTQIV